VLGDFYYFKFITSWLRWNYGTARSGW